MLGLELTSSRTGFKFFISKMSKPKICRVAVKEIGM